MLLDADLDVYFVIVQLPSVLFVVFVVRLWVMPSLAVAKPRSSLVDQQKSLVLLFVERSVSILSVALLAVLLLHRVSVHLEGRLVQ